MALSLRTASAVVRRDANPYKPDEDLRAYYRELLGPFGVEIDEELFQRSTNIGFAELAEGTLRGLATPIKDPDLLVLAYGLPDMFPLKSTTSHLNYLLGGGSRSFAVSEQGLRAPFTALRIADAYARSGRCASLALFVCEQTTLPYHDPLVHDTPLVDSAALLYFDGGGGWEFQATWPGLPGQGPEQVLAASLAGRESERTLLVVGPWMQPDAVATVQTPVHRVDAGSYCTSVWLDLARHHQVWARDYDSLVLCDHDPRTGRSQAALLRRTPEKVAMP